MAVKKEGVTYDEIVRSVRAGNFAPVYYLMGEEAYYIDKVSEFIVDTALKEEEKDFNLTVWYGRDGRRSHQCGKAFPDDGGTAGGFGEGGTEFTRKRASFLLPGASADLYGADFLP